MNALIQSTEARHAQRRQAEALPEGFGSPRRLRTLRERITTLRAQGSWVCIAGCTEPDETGVERPRRILGVLSKDALAVCPECLTRWKAAEAAKLVSSRPRADVLRQAHVPAKIYREPFRIDQVHSAAGQNAARNFKALRPVVLITGCNGAGKSFLAAELLYQAHRLGAGSCFWTSTGLLAEEAAKGFQAQRPEMAGALRAGVLVLDELGMGDRGKPGKDIVAHVVGHRVDNLLPLIVTTQLTVTRDSLQAYSGAIADRVSSADVIDLTGGSQR